MVVSNDPLIHDSLSSPLVMKRSCEVSPMMGDRFGSAINESYDTGQSASLVDAQRVESLCVRSSHTVHDNKEYERGCFSLNYPTGSEQLV
jgi:hypothetical protein